MALAGFGAAIVYIAKVLDFLSKLKAAFRVFRPSQQPYRYSPADIGREHNVRFGFAFDYPKTWDRGDPHNVDGNMYLHPLDRQINVRVWGRFAHFASNMNIDAAGLR